MIWLILYLALAIINYGVWYAYWTNKFPTLDSESERDSNSSYCFFLAVFTPLTLVMALFFTNIFYYGIQFKGGPRNDHR